jgi:outer membrane protein assembly factor BamB
VTNGVVYIGTLDNNNLYALNASTGAKLWSVTASDYVDSSPAVAKGVVYFGSQDGAIYAVDATTGGGLWRFILNGDPTSPAVANGVVYFGSNDDNIYALNASTGAKLWSYNTGHQVDASPAIVNGVLYIGSNDHKVHAFGLK